MKRFFLFFLISYVLTATCIAQDIDSDLRIALRNLIERADSGEEKALYQLAKLYDTGYDSIPVDSLKSSVLYLRAAEKGYAPAMNFIGFRYYKGEHMNQNVDSALYWIRKAALAGDITAAANLGYLLTEAPEVEHNETEALDWLAIASDAGMGEAQINLVDLAQKLQSPKALALLGDAYAKGMGVVYDNKKSIEYFYRAAKAGNPSAQFVMAELLDFFPDILEVTDMPKEETQAQYWYEKAGQQGINDSETAYRDLYSMPLSEDFPIENH